MGCDAGSGWLGVEKARSALDTDFNDTFLKEDRLASSWALASAVATEDRSKIHI